MGRLMEASALSASGVGNYRGRILLFVLQIKQKGPFTQPGGIVAIWHRQHRQPNSQTPVSLGKHAIRTGSPDDNLTKWNAVGKHGNMAAWRHDRPCSRAVRHARPRRLETRDGPPAWNFLSSWPWRAPPPSTQGARFQKAPYFC